MYITETKCLSSKISMTQCPKQSLLYLVLSCFVTVTCLLGLYYFFCVALHLSFNRVQQYNLVALSHVPPT